MLCVSFATKATDVFPKHILKSKTCNQSIQARKKLFCHVIVNNYLCNVLCKFLIKIESMWRCKIKEQTPQLTLLTVVGLSEAATRAVLYKKKFLKILQYPQETLVLESLFKIFLKKVAGATLLKRDPNTGVFL